MSLRSSRIVKTKASDTPFTMYMSAQPLPIGASGTGMGIDVTKVTLLPWKPLSLADKTPFQALI